MVRSSPVRSVCAVVVFVVLSACGGGSSSGGGTAVRACGEAGAFCLVSCNLGCGSITCDLTDIAQNAVLRFDFNQEVDTSTVDFSTISLRTAAGIEPAGQFVVSGQTVTFLPSVRTVEGQSFYGFEQNQTYALAVLGGSGAARALRSTSGQRLPSTYECSLRVTLGLVDFEPGPPQARVVAPTSAENVALDQSFVIRFDEILDETAFLGANTIDGPIAVTARPLVEVDGGRVCDSSSGNVVGLPGSFTLLSDTVAQETTWSYRPAQELPPSRCIEISITSQVRDLANNPAVNRVFRFVTVEGEGGTVVESFDDDEFFDRDRSAGSWGGGVVSFGRIGGDGAHGDFDLEDGEETAEGSGVFVFDTDLQVLEGGPNTRETVVEGGVFRFSSLVLPPGRTLRFAGSNPARVHVAGQCVVIGTIDVSGIDVPNTHEPLSMAGQSGGVGGPGGGRGGDGAFASDGLGDPNGIQNLERNFFRGFDGEGVRVPANHLGAGAMTAASGGRGAALRPAHGDTSQLVFETVFPTVGPHFFGVPQVGGGGASATAGGVGELRNEATVGASAGAAIVPPESGAAGGAAFGVIATYDPLATDSATHFAVGGAGGGGGGSSPLYSIDPAVSTEPTNSRWWSGGAGAGGGGVLVLRTGAALTVLGSLSARGGGVDDIALVSGSVPGLPTSPATGIAGPGGGGAGGALLVQCGGSLDLLQAQALDVRGGRGAVMVGAGSFRGFDLESGAGAPGVLRVEKAGEAPAVADLAASALPAATADSVGLLLDRDDRVVVQSCWYSTHTVFPVDFERYELDVRIDGQSVRFRDDELSSAAFLGAPVRIRFQGALLDPETGNPVFDPETGMTAGIGPWRDFVSDVGSGLVPPRAGLVEDSATGFRFRVELDRTVVGDAEVEVDSVRVSFR